MDQVNWSKLKTFYKVASCGSFARAAEKYNITPSALSKMVKSLEDELNCQLFIRTEAGIELTPKGELLYRDAIRISNMLGVTQFVLSRGQREIKKHIKLVAPNGLSSLYVTHFIDGYLSIYPDVHLEVVSYNDMSLNEKLNGHVLIHPFIKDLHGYNQTPLATMHVGLFASQEYLSKFGAPSSPQDLDNHRLIAFSRNVIKPIDMNWHLKIGMPNNEERTPILEADGNLGRTILAHKGVGIITITDKHPDIKKYNLVQVLPDIKGPSYAYHIITDEKLYENEKIRSLVEHLKKSFTE